MPRDTIDRAIKRGAGSDADANYDEVRYEGYGPGGVAVIVEALTDNRNRTAGEVRSSFTKSGGNLGETNSVSFMFDRMGEILFPPKAGRADEMLEAALDAGADNVESGEGEEGAHEIYCARRISARVREALEKSLGEPASAKLMWRPKNTTPVDGEAAQTLLELIDALDDNDDVQNVYANFEICPDDAAARSSRPELCEWALARCDLLGLDPGLRHTGWGVIDVDGNRLRHVAHGVVKAPADQSLAERLCALFEAIAAVIAAQQPAEAAVEETFVNKNPGSTLKLGQARGVVLLAPARAGLPVAEYSANLVKKSVVGAGHADKDQVR